MKVTLDMMLKPKYVGRNSGARIAAGPLYLQYTTRFDTDDTLLPALLIEGRDLFFRPTYRLVAMHLHEDGNKVFLFPIVDTRSIVYEHKSKVIGRIGWYPVINPCTRTWMAYLHSNFEKEFLRYGFCKETQMFNHSLPYKSDKSEI